MSKIGKKPIPIPASAKLEREGDILRVHGPKGSLSLDFKGLVDFSYDESSGLAHVSPKQGGAMKYWGLYRTLVNNMIIGVVDGFEKKLELIGVGYKASVQDGRLVLNVGYSHPVIFDSEDGIAFEVKDNVITVKGIDKVKVGEIAAKIRSVRPPEPYKGKGVRYLGEVVELKKRRSGK